MPGLIDNHWHVMFAGATFAQLAGGDDFSAALLAALQAEATLMRGFTTVRDVGGNSFSVKQAIDGGLYPGPRIYPSGARLSHKNLTCCRKPLKVSGQSVKFSSAS